jgi:hypothetical protein
MCPTYLFLNNNTGEEFEDFMSISALDQFLEENPNIVQLVNGAPLIHSGRGMGKPDSGFRDLLKDIKKKNSKGISRSSINTF